MANYSLLSGSLFVSGSVSSSLGFSGSFFGDGSGLTGIPMAAGVISGSIQVDHDQTTNFDANEHVDHTTVSITGTGGVTGGGSITTSRALTLNTSDVQFTSGVKSKMNADNVLSGSMDNTGPFQPTGSSYNITSDVEITGSLIVTDGVTGVSYTDLSNIPADIISSSAQLPAGIISSSAQLPAGLVSSSIQLASDISGSFTAPSASFSTRVTSNEGRLDALQLVTGSYATTASNQFNGNQQITGSLIITSNLTVNGIVSASQYNTLIVSSSIIYSSGSTKFGDSMDDLHEFTGSLRTTGSLDVDGVIRATGDVFAYYSSDQRLKTDIVLIDGALDKVAGLGGYEFNWNEDNQEEHSGHDYGVIAQEVESIFPELVQTRTNGYKAVRYEKLIPALIQAVKELKHRIEKLENS